MENHEVCVMQVCVMQVEATFTAASRSSDKLCSAWFWCCWPGNVMVMSSWRRASVWDCFTASVKVSFWKCSIARYQQPSTHSHKVWPWILLSSIWSF